MAVYPDEENMCDGVSGLDVEMVPAGFKFFVNGW
jgi:hypothetical protein